STSTVKAWRSEETAIPGTVPKPEVMRSKERAAGDRRTMGEGLSFRATRDGKALADQPSPCGDPRADLEAQSRRSPRSSMRWSEAFRSRSLPVGAYTYVWMDAEP